MFNKVVDDIRIEISNFDREINLYIAEWRDGEIYGFEMAEKVYELGKQRGIDKLVNKLRVASDIECGLNFLHREFSDDNREEFEREMDNIKTKVAELLKY